MTATAAELLLNASSSYAIAHQNQQAELSSSGLSGPSEEQQTSRAGLSRENQQQQLQQAKQQLEMNLSGDISRIIQHERESSSIQAMTTMASATSSTSTPLSKPVEQAEAAVSHASITTTKQEADVVVEDNPQQQQQTAVELAKEMEKFDYDLIQSSSSQVQANELPNANHHQQHFNKQLQMAQVIDFVPQQRQQQQPSNEQVELMPPVNRLQPQVVVPQPQAEQQQAQAQRVPIYRSVFKSLKGQQNGPQHHFRQQLDRNGNPRNVVAIARRRRDRNQQPQVMANEQSHRTMRQPRPSFQFGEKHDQVGQLVDLQQPPMAMAAQPQQQVQMHNHTRASSSVANYLQLLNSRYNFRLPRVGGGPSPASPSPTWSS